MQHTACQLCMKTFTTSGDFMSAPTLVSLCGFSVEGDHGGCRNLMLNLEIFKKNNIALVQESFLIAQNQDHLTFASAGLQKFIFS